MKAAAATELSLALVLWAAPAAAWCAAVPTTLEGMVLYKSLPLSGRMNGIVQIQCSDSLHCSIRHRTQQVAGTPGALEIWQDAHITPPLRAELWGHAGAALIFAGQPARNALLLLRNAAGQIVAQSATEVPLVDLDPLLTGEPSAAFLISIDYRTPQAAVISRGILQVDLAKPSLSFATYTGPKALFVFRPDGVTATVAVPGPNAVIAFDSNFVLQTNPSAHSAELTVIGCYPSSYVNYRTRLKVDTVLTVRARYELENGTWVRTAQLAYDDCGGQYRVPTSIEHN